MEESVVAAVPPPLPPKTRLRGSASARGGAPTPGAAPVAATGLYSSAAGGGGGGTALSSISTTGEHVVKIRISPEDGNNTSTSSTGSVRISVGGGDEDMVRRAPGDLVYLKQPDRNTNPYFFCSSFQSSAMVISSGQSSPSDTLDSGTCSDLDGSTPPPLPKKTGSLAAAAAAAAAAATVTVTVNGDHASSLGNHRRTGSLTSSGAEADSDEDAGSNISCDSLNSHDLNGGTNGHDIGDDGFVKLPLSNGIGKHHNNYNGHNHHDAMESIEEERAVAPPPPPPLKSVALTVRANDFVNNIANGIKNLPSPVIIPEDRPVSVSTFASIPKPPPPKTPAKPIKGLPIHNGQVTFLPQGLLQDIRDRTATLTGPGSAGQKKLRTWGSPAEKSADALRSPEAKEYPKQASTLFRLHAATAAEEGINGPKAGLVQERTYEERVREQTAAAVPTGPRPGTGSYKYEEDRYYQFHLRERDPEPETAAVVARTETADSDEETFAGLRDVLGSKDASATIRSAKGTVRGVRNRVRAGIATFLHFPDSKNYKEKEAGKVVLYVTTMGIVRHTFQECLKVKKIMRTLLVKYEERDAFMSREVQAELRERMHSDDVEVPQLFIEGQYIGGAETIERLNETGELRKMLKPFKSPDVCHECQVCGGFRLLPCSVCNGSKKSMHRNDFTAEFVALKCMHCDEVGLVKCHAC